MREGVTKVIFPAANLSELSLLPPEVLEAEINFIPVRTMDEVIREALIPLKTTHLPIHENQPSENTHQAQ